MTNVTLPDGTIVEVPEAETELEVPELGTVVVHQHSIAKRTIEAWRKPAFTAIQESWAPEFQELENAFWQILVSGYLDQAFGFSLDVLGRIVGEERQSATDPDYRVRIRARVLINRSFGLPEDLLGICAALGVVARYTNYGRACARVDVRELPVNGSTRRQIAGLLGEAVSAGVRLHVSVPASATPFRLGWSGASGIGRAKLQWSGGGVADCGQLTHGFNT